MLVYMDNLVVISNTINENIKSLMIVLKTAADHDLNIKWKKYQFLKKQIDYLGYRIKHKLCPSPLNIAAVTKYPKLQSLKQIQSFLILTGYFRKFIKDYTSIARPLSELFKKDKLFMYRLNKIVHLIH